MAKLDFQQTDLVVTLSVGEMIAAMNGSMRIPLLAIRGAEAVTRGWPRTLGLRLPGTYVPFLIIAGSYIWRKNKAFVIWHRGQQAVQINLGSGFYNRVIVGVEDAQHWVDEITMMITSC